jgi:hypothetical protein
MISVNYKYLLKEDIIMFGFIKNLFGSKAPEATVADVPYKVESPVAEKAVEAVVTSVAPAKKPAAKKKPQGQKPAQGKPQSGAKPRGRKPKAK